MLERVRATSSATLLRDSRSAKRSAVTLGASTAASALFIAGMPLHKFFHAWGQIALLIWGLTVALAFWKFAFLDVAYCNARAWDRFR
jgi:hypothetical protein